MALGVLVFAFGVLIIGLAVSFAVTMVLERADVIPREHRLRWVLMIAPVALGVVGILGWVFI